MLSRISLTLALFCYLGGLLLADDTKPPQVSEPVAGLQLEDVPEPLVERQPRSEAEEDRLEALALFAAGRTKLQQQKFVEALRLYQRALRYDPAALPVLEQIVPLAFQLNRTAEAIRYALKAAELKPSDPLLVSRLAAHLSERKELEKALELYEKALALETEGQTKTARHVVLRLEMGRLYYLTRQYDKAAEAFIEVQHGLDKPDEFGLTPDLSKSLFKEPVRLYELFGDSFRHAGDFPRAIAAYERASKEGLAPEVLAYRMAQVYMANKKPKKALGQLQIYFESRQPSQGTAPYKLLEEVLTEQGKEQTLVARLETLYAEDGENAPLGFVLANHYQEAGQLDKAEPIFQRMHEKSPSTESYRGLAHVYRMRKQQTKLLELLADVADKSGELTVLGEEFKAILADEPLVKEVVETARAQLADKAEAVSYGTRLAVALLALDAKQWETAGEFFDLALKENDKKAAEVLLTWGIGLLGSERYAESAAVFQRGIDSQALPKDNPAFYYYMAGALELAEQTEDALLAARRAAKIAEDNPRMHSRVAWVLYHARRYDDAYQSYVELIEQFGEKYDSTEVRNVVRDARLALSNLCVLRKNLPEAEEWLEQILDEFPENVSALNDLGYLWADQGKHLQRALEMVQQAVAADPENHAYLDSLGWALYRLGRYEEALEPLKKAVSGEEPDGVILDHLADCYQKLGKTDEALRLWRQAIETWEAEHDADKIKSANDKIKQFSS